MPLNPISFTSILILSCHLWLGLSGVFASGFSPKTLYAHLLFPKRATCPTHLILLNLITRITFGEQCTSRCSSYIVFSTSSGQNRQCIWHNTLTSSLPRRPAISRQSLCYVGFWPRTFRGRAIPLQTSEWYCSVSNSSYWPSSDFLMVSFVILTTMSLLLCLCLRILQFGWSKDFWAFYKTEIFDVLLQTAWPSSSASQILPTVE